jgi:gas vesicle protein
MSKSIENTLEDIPELAYSLNSAQLSAPDATNETTSTEVSMVNISINLEAQKVIDSLSEVARGVLYQFIGTLFIKDDINDQSQANSKTVIMIEQLINNTAYCAYQMTTEISKYINSLNTMEERALFANSLLELHFKGDTVNITEDQGKFASFLINTWLTMKPNAPSELAIITGSRGTNIKHADQNTIIPKNVIATLQEETGTLNNKIMQHASDTAQEIISDITDIQQKTFSKVAQEVKNGVKDLVHNVQEELTEGIQKISDALEDAAYQQLSALFNSYIREELTSTTPMIAGNQGSDQQVSQANSESHQGIISRVINLAQTAGTKIIINFLYHLTGKHPSNPQLAEEVVTNQQLTLDIQNKKNAPAPSSLNDFDMIGQKVGELIEEPSKEHQDQNIGSYDVILAGGDNPVS